MSGQGLRTGLIALLMAACGGASGGTVAADLPSSTFAEMDSTELDATARDAILAGEQAGPGYNSDPPTSGPHADDYADCGVYRVEIPDIYQVHSLKRGTVIVQYRPTIPAATREALEDLVGSFPADAIVAPRSGLSVPVVVTAWTRMVTLDGADLETIRAFWADYAQTGPANADCPMTVTLAE